MKRAIRLPVFGTICLFLWPPLATAHRFLESISAMAKTRLVGLKSRRNSLAKWPTVACRHESSSTVNRLE